MNKLLLPSKRILTPRNSIASWERHGSKPWEFLPKWLLRQPALMNKYSPGAGCVCCGPGDSCTLLNDTFDRANSTNLGSDWTEGGGSIDLEISSNSVIRVSGNPTYAISTVTHSSGDIRVTMAVTAPTSGSKFRIIFDFVDASNYVFAEFTTGGGAGGGVRLWKRVGGTETALTSTAAITASGSFTWDACMRGPYFSAGSSTTRANAFWSSANGTFGLGFGSTTANMKIDSFLAQKVEEGCDVCMGSTCNGVCDAAYPLPFQIQAVLSGMHNNAFGVVCPDCADLDGTYVLDARYNSPCWFCYAGTPICGTCPFELYIQIADLNPSIPGGGINAWLGFPNLDGDGNCPECTGRGFIGAEHTWSANLGPGADCSSFSGLVMADGSGLSIPEPCHSDGSTLTVTAL